LGESRPRVPEPGRRFHQQPRKLGAEGRLGKFKRKALGFSGLCGWVPVNGPFHQSMFEKEWKSLPFLDTLQKIKFFAG